MNYFLKYDYSGDFEKCFSVASPVEQFKSKSDQHKLLLRLTGSEVLLNPVLVPEIHRPKFFCHIKVKRDVNTRF